MDADESVKRKQNENANGESELWYFLEDLRIKAETNKDFRIQYKQITFYIQLLQDNGTRMPENITKHIEDGIWELRPGNNRVLYFFFKDNTFILLHQFRKKLRKRRVRKLKKQNPNAKIFYQERSINYENME